MRGLSVAAPNPMLAKSPTSRRCYDAAGTSKLRIVHVDVEHRPRRPAPLYGQRLSGAEPGRSCRLRGVRRGDPARRPRSEEHTSELQSLMRISYAVFCLKKKK